MLIKIFNEKYKTFKGITLQDKNHIENLVKLNESNYHLDFGHFKWENGVCSIDEDHQLDKKTKQICRKLSLEMFLEQKEDSNINYMIVYKNPLFKELE